MKKLLAALAIISSSTAMAAGSLDGYWMVNIGGQSMIFSAIQNDNQIVVAQLSSALDGWGAASGVLNGNTVTLYSMQGYSPVSGSWTVNFTSNSTASVIQNSCSAVAGDYCQFQSGVAGTATKIF